MQSKYKLFEISNTLSTVEILHDSVLYKSTTDLAIALQLTNTALPDHVANVQQCWPACADVELNTIPNFSLKLDSHRASRFRHTDSGIPLSTCS